MQLLFMNHWLSASLMKAICWTLVHSLWQGLILAAVAGALVLFTRKFSAAFRYNLLAALFLVFMAVVSITFFTLFDGRAATEERIPVLTVQNGEQTGLPALEGHAVAGNGGDYVTAFGKYFNEHASLLVTIWFIIFLAKALKLFGGLVYIQRIRHYKIKTPEVYWTRRMEELAVVLGVTAPVKLMESALVNVPMVVGLLKPVVLVPLGLLAGMPADQVEAILLHELAHIRRRDFLVNLAQSFAETLFFFNPAVLWLSSLLRQEREHCCDDMAIAVTHSKTGYIHALVSFQEYQLENSTPYAMAFPGKKDQLLNRVKRIVDNSHKSLNLAEKTFLVVCLGLILLLSMVYGRPAEQKDLQASERLTNTTADMPGPDRHEPGAPAEKGVVIPDNSFDEHTEPVPQQRPEPTKHDTVPVPNDRDVYRAPYDARYNGSQVVVSEKQPYYPVQPYKPYEGGVPVYQPKVDTLPVLQKGNSVLTGVITHSKGGKEYKIVVDHNKVVGLSIDGEKIADDQISNYNEVIQGIFGKMQGESQQHFDAKLKEASAKTQQLNAQNNLLKQEQLVLQSQINGLNAQLSPIKLDTDNKLNLLSDTTKRKVRGNKMKSITDEIVEDLVKAGIVTITNPLSFTLNDREFLVNHEQQSPAIRQRFQEKYVKKSTDTYLYSREGGRTSSTVIVH